MRTSLARVCEKFENSAIISPKSSCAENAKAKRTIKMTTRNVDICGAASSRVLTSCESFGLDCRNSKTLKNERKIANARVRRSETRMNSTLLKSTYLSSLTSNSKSSRTLTDCMRNAKRRMKRVIRVRSSQFQPCEKYSMR
eukprot:Amastigsp_a676905_368.p4 type:complete len:141 gc:universal Amastigsp_a676905_368:617-1039(+)